MTPAIPANPDPDPRTAPGLDAHGAVLPGETPPAEGSTSEAGPLEVHNPHTGWAKGPLIAIFGMTLFFAAFFLAYGLILVL